MKSLFIPILVFSLIVPALGKQRTFRVLYLNAPPTAPKKVHLFDGKDFQQIKLPKMNFSRVYKLPSGPLTLKFFESIPDEFAGEGENPLFLKAPAVQIPEDLTDFYLLISPAPANPVAPIKAFVQPAGDDELERGQTLWFNLTENQIAGKLGSERFTLAPLGRETTDAPIAEAGQFKVTVYYKQPESEHANPVVNTYWRHDPRSKSVGFIIPQTGRRTPRIMVFRDFR